MRNAPERSVSLSVTSSTDATEHTHKSRSSFPFSLSLATDHLRFSRFNIQFSFVRRSKQLIHAIGVRVSISTSNRSSHKKKKIIIIGGLDHKKEDDQHMWKRDFDDVDVRNVKSNFQKGLQSDDYMRDY